METPDELTDEVLRAKAAHFSGDHDVMCLHVLAQPLVGEMQMIIRYQQRMIERTTDAIDYILARVANDSRLSEVMGCATESYDRLTKAFADAKNLNVDELRNRLIPGSAAFHRRRRYDPCH